MDLCFKKDSKMFACLVGTLTVASRKPPLDFWEMLKFETLSLLTVVAFINDDQFEVRGQVLVSLYFCSFAFILIFFSCCSLNISHLKWYLC